MSHKWGSDVNKATTSRPTHNHWGLDPWDQSRGQDPWGQVHEAEVNYKYSRKDKQNRLVERMTIT